MATKAPTTKPASPRKPKRLRPALAPDRYLQRDFFTADISDVASKDDRHSMEHPMFSIAKKPQMEARVYEYSNVTVSITPGSLGAPTIWDKDILIYAISQVVEGKNRARSDAQQKRIRFKAFDFLRATNRRTNGDEYRRIEDSLSRLRSTEIKTNIETGGKRIRKGFGFIDNWEIVERSSDGRMEAIELTLSDWIYNAIQNFEVLTLNRDYFRLTGGLERRLYELARKHCGGQATWQIALEQLHRKSGSNAKIREFRRMLKDMIEADNLPDYRIRFDMERDLVMFYQKDPKAFALAAEQGETWLS